MTDLRRWLADIGLEQFCDTFQREGVDLDVVPDLDDRDLQQLGLTLGQRKRLLKAAAKLAAVPPVKADNSAKSPGLSQPPPRAERRQVTVLFCDLAESTRLAEQLGEEAFSDVIRAYQQMCTGAIRRFDGHVGRYMGDGVLAYFGFPRAHEEDAQRAVRSALALVSGNVDLNRKTQSTYGISVAIRIGIHTGPVVAGDLSSTGTPDEISGVTPNIAARLQAAAAPNSIVIGPLTRELLYDHFACRPLGPTELKGLSRPLEVFVVEGERLVESRFAARSTRNLAPLVGRDTELTLLYERWQRADQGEGQVVVLSGEAGIGKSRLAQGLRDRIGAESATVVGLQCSPYHSSSAFFPFIDRFERIAKWGAADAPAQKLERLAQLLRSSSENLEEDVPLFANMLMIPPVAGSRSAEGTAEQVRERIIDAIGRQVLHLAASQPVLLVFEDAHWADPTSIDVLETIAARIESARVMLLVTCRSEAAPVLRRAPVSHLALNRLSRRDRRELALRVAGSHQISEAVLGQIVEKTDGVPLFVEELARTAIESPVEPGRGDFQGAMILPPTLQDSLVARLDRLPVGKDIAQVGAVIGREFSFDVLSAVVPMPEPQLRAALNALVDSEIVLPRGRSDNPSYSFRHALVQEAAYRSLLTNRRRELHGETAHVLDERFPGLSSTQPEVVAHHYTESGNLPKAIDYWKEAGRLAASRSANAEAAFHLSTGLHLLERLPATPIRDSQELDLLIALGPVLINTKGPGVPEVERTYARAVELCGRVPVTTKHFAVYWGQWRISRTFEIKRARADQLFAVAETLRDPAYLLQAHHAEWATRFVLGDQTSCCAHIDKGLELYDGADYRWQAAVYGGHDAKVCGLGEAGLALWLRGYPEQALARCEKALAVSKALNHAGSRAHALDYALMLHWFRRDGQAIKRLVDELFEVADRQGFVDYRSRAQLYRGWARAEGGDLAGGMDDLRLGVAAQRATATKEDFPIFLDMLAQGVARTGEQAEERALIAEALAHARESGMRHWLAELYRRQGDLLVDESSVPLPAARESLETALAIATEQDARALQLRAAVSLLRHDRRVGREEAAHLRLTEMLSGFQEGLESPDLVDARSLLRTLR